MDAQLVVHRGGWQATQADLASVPVPEPTDSYVPVPYGRFVEEVELHVPRFGLKVNDARFALARDGNQMFGVLSCTNGHGASDWGLAIGLRNSYDRSLSVGLVAGTHVFCCDNLAFSGEVAMQRKHTANVFRDLPDLIYRMLSGVSSMRSRIAEETEAMKVRELDVETVDHVLVESVRRNALPASQIPKVLEAWEHPRYGAFEPRTAWSLYNAFTEVQKARSPRAQMDDTLRLTGVFREVLAL